MKYYTDTLFPAKKPANDQQAFLCYSKASIWNETIIQNNPEQTPFFFIQYVLTALTGGK